MRKVKRIALDAERADGRGQGGKAPKGNANFASLPGQHFCSMPIPVGLWFLAQSKAGKNLHARGLETLLIDVQKMGALIDRTRHERTDADLEIISYSYHAWRGAKMRGRVEKVWEGLVAGFLACSIK